MVDRSSRLRGLRILIVEDEYAIAADLAEMVEEIGATALGPVGSVRTALGLIDAEERIDGAVLDVNLGAENVFPVAELLASRHVPFVFATGYGEGMIPETYSHVRRYEKPVTVASLTATLVKWRDEAGVRLSEPERQDS
jgi:two-component SAPR family response regulator